MEAKDGHTLFITVTCCALSSILGRVREYFQLKEDEPLAVEILQQGAAMNEYQHK